MTEEEARAMEARMKANGAAASLCGLGQTIMPVQSLKPSKWKNVKKSIDGHTFDSTGEANRYIELKALESAGVISNLELQPRFILQDKQKGIRAIEYRADFRYRDIAGLWINEDFKGAETEIFKLKMKIFRRKYPEERLDIIKKGKR